MNTIDLNLEHFLPVHTSVTITEMENEKVLRVVKTEKIMEFDENTYAKLNVIPFQNGIIEVKMLSRILHDAPDFARGFIGLAFRINEDDTKFESFYLRPTNGKNCKDKTRKSHGCQYFAYPYYTFSYFRDHNITKYEAPVDVDINEWITLKAIINGDCADFFINNSNKPTLTVKDLKHGKKLIGTVGFFVDIGTEAFFKDLKITITD